MEESGKCGVGYGEIERNVNERSTRGGRLIGFGKGEGILAIESLNGFVEKGLAHGVEFGNSVADFVERGEIDFCREKRAEFRFDPSIEAIERSLIHDGFDLLDVELVVNKGFEAGKAVLKFAAIENAGGEIRNPLQIGKSLCAGDGGEDAASSSGFEPLAFGSLEEGDTRKLLLQKGSQRIGSGCADLIGDAGNLIERVFFRDEFPDGGGNGVIDLIPLVEQACDEAFGFLEFRARINSADFLQEIETFVHCNVGEEIRKFGILVGPFV